MVCELYHSAENSLRVGYNFYDNDSANNPIEWQSGDRLSNLLLKPRLGVKIGAIPYLKIPSDAAEEDFWSFLKILVRKYVDVPCDEVEKIDSNHMNLGMRYAWVSSELLYEAGERFDVFSINGYRIPYPPETAEVYEKSNKPVMIGEFHFGSIDRGLPSTGITGVANQQERGKAYRNYVEHGLSRN